MIIPKENIRLHSIEVVSRFPYISDRRLKVPIGTILQ